MIQLSSLAFQTLFVFQILVATSVHADDQPLFKVEPQIVQEHDDGVFLWYHPRAAAIPAEPSVANQTPQVVMTLQKHLHVSDYYSGLYTMTSADLGKSWTGPTEIPSLAWQKTEDGSTIAVCDVTPGWHAPTKRLLAIGVKVLYTPKGEQVVVTPHSHEVAYAIYDPAKNEWSTWKFVDLPHADDKYFLAVAGCCQWLVEPDGSLLIPIYHKGPTGEAYSSTVIRCAFDGQSMTLAQEGQTLTHNEVRGVYEPSLAKVGDTFYLTLRNDLRGYVTTSKDGLNYEPIRPWTFDDGTDLGSYNTQAHWLTHGERLYLVYTRRGANNDHIMRHRAPLFIAEVDREKLVVKRSTEQVAIPERGGEMGNFGASSITPDESWITVGEGVWNDDARKRGAKGALFIGRVRFQNH